MEAWSGSTKQEQGKMGQHHKQDAGLNDDDDDDDNKGKIGLHHKQNADAINKPETIKTIKNTKNCFHKSTKQTKN